MNTNRAEGRDPELEAMIDKAGRDAVFARARQYGWSANLPPPAYVWRGIATEIQTGRLLRAKEADHG